MRLEDFLPIAERARQKIPRGGISWSDSPLAWMRGHSPTAKSSMCRSIIIDWLELHDRPYAELPAVDEAHLRVAGKRVTVHFSCLNKSGEFRFSQLKEADKVDYMLLLGIEPHRVRIWATEPARIVDLPTYRENAPGLHALMFAPDEVPTARVQELACWDDAPPPDDWQEALW